jgi:hypothetical protein
MGAGQYFLFCMWEINENMTQAVQAGTLLVCIFLTRCVDVGRGGLECHHVGWHVVRSYPWP